MKHVLVTGANGYLGASLVPALLASRQVGKVTVLVRQAHRIGAGHQSIFPAGVSVVDVMRVCDGSFALNEVDVVCHLAAGRNAAAPADVAASLEFTYTLLALASAAGVRGFINASSQAVYGLAEPMWTEEDQIAPVSPYGMAKYASELMTKSASRTSPNTRTTSLRFCKLVGPSPQFRVEPGEPAHVFAHCALAGKKLTLPAHGQQKLDLMDVRDAAAVIVKLIESSFQKWPDVMNVGSDTQVSLLALAQMVSRLALASHARPLLFQPDENNTRKQRDFGMSIARLESSLDWRARYSLEETLVDVIRLLAIKQNLPQRKTT